MIKKRTRPQLRKRESSLEAQDEPGFEGEGDDKLPYVFFLLTLHTEEPSEFAGKFVQTRRSH